MAEKIKVPLGDTVVEAIDVPVVESNERWSDLKLEDGARLRVKMTVISVLRSEGVYDPQGNPQYILNMTPTMAVIEAPSHLRKKD